MGVSGPSLLIESTDSMIIHVGIHTLYTDGNLFTGVPKLVGNQAAEGVAT